MSDTKTSGAPEKKIIWDENNVLVDPELDAKAKAASRKVLGLDKPESGSSVVGATHSPERTQQPTKTSGEAGGSA
jgi:hypothetical protein